MSIAGGYGDQEPNPQADATGISIERLNTAQVMLDGVRRADDVTDVVSRRRYLHAGPPVDVHAMTGPMRGAVIGALLFEEEAADPDEAAALIDAGAVEIVPCHHAGGVGAMAGIISPSMPVVVARSSETTTFSPLNEGTQGAVRYGSYDPATLSRLRWMSTAMAPSLDAAIQASDDIDLVALVAEGLRRGDECHNRLVATTANLLGLLAPALVRTQPSTAEQVLSIISGNGHFALPFAISMGKALSLAASDVPGSAVVTAMAANGVDFGIQVSGTGSRWFTAPSPVGEPLLIEGATLADVNPTMGDSLIAETTGFGAFAMSAAPAIMSFVGGTAEDATRIVGEMRQICAGESTRLLLPTENYRGTPLGIDVRMVASVGVAPVVNNGLAHREAGRGRVGAGITRVPIECFVEANAALSELAGR